MSLYTIGDFHLSESSNKPMDIFGDKWKNHIEKLKENFSQLKDDDVTVICGDLSWGMTLQDCLKDFQFVDSLPGKKILLKGNHDYYWGTLSKMNSFLHENGIESIMFLNNNSFSYNGVSICGTRGWFYEEETGSSHDKLIMDREIQRLKTSLDSAQNNEKIVFLHYPPIYNRQNFKCEEILELLKDNNIRSCYYGHIHGLGLKYIFEGWSDGCKYTCCSADYIDFKPIKVL